MVVKRLKVGSRSRNKGAGCKVQEARSKKREQGAGWRAESGKTQGFDSSNPKSRKCNDKIQHSTLTFIEVSNKYDA